MSDSTAVGTDVQPFDFNGNPIRVVMIDGEPWFVAAEVCRVLEISNPADAVRRLDDDEYQLVSGTIVSTDGGPGRYVINESGLYSFVLGSRKPEAKAFKRWVTSEVLPQIRKTGAYRPALTPSEQRRALARAVLEAEDRADLWEGRARAERAAVEAAKPKVEAFDELMNAEGHYSLANAAQILGMGRQTFIQHLHRLGMIMNKPGHSDHLRPYRAHERAGRFVVKARTFQVVSKTRGEEETRTEGTTYVTPRGLTHIRQLLGPPSPKVDDRLL